MSSPQLVILQRRGGRPPRYGRRATSRVEFVTTPEQKEDLRQIARDERTSVADVIKQAVDEFVGDYREKRVFGS